jgi:hypothetical protein
LFCALSESSSVGFIGGGSISWGSRLPAHRHRMRGTRPKVTGDSGRRNVPPDSAAAYAALSALIQIQRSSKVRESLPGNGMNELDTRRQTIDEARQVKPLSPEGHPEKFEVPVRGKDASPVSSA